MTDTEAGHPEQRRFNRIPFEAAAGVECGGQRLAVRLLDLSLHGALVARPPDWQVAPGTRCRLRVELDQDGGQNGGDGQADGVSITMEATAVHAEDARIGFRCDVIDVESMSHLRRLVELNLGDPGLLERDLEALIQAADTGAPPDPPGRS